MPPDRRRLPSLWQTMKRFVYGLLPTKVLFTRRYRGGGWGSTESVSGRGSTLANTEPLRRELPRLLARFEIASMLDAPCGDFNWMQETLRAAPPGLSYIGADIVTPLIESIRRHETEHVRFCVANLITDDLPPVDLILCRDCFIHFSIADIHRSIRNFKRSGARYLLTNSFREIRENVDIETGRWRQINLERPPFNFPAPLAAIPEQGTNGKFLGLWGLASIPEGARAPR